MAENSKIEWTDHTANLWHGCTPVHEGCDNCYACSISKRYGREIWGNDKPRYAVESFWKDIEKFQKDALKDNVKRMVFVGSMMDIFEKPMPIVKFNGLPYNVFNGIERGDFTTDDLRQYFFNNIVSDCPNLIFLLLTKRPSNINKYIPESWKLNPPSNVIFGTSPVNQATFNTLVPQLNQVNGKRFLSIEPLLEKIENLNLSGIDWVIVGGESGPKSRPIEENWVLEIRDYCQSQNIPFFFKQWGGVHKKKTGKLLDGKYYEEFPIININ
jgi:protein gp37